MVFYQFYNKEGVKPPARCDCSAYASESDLHHSTNVIRHSSVNRVSSKESERKTWNIEPRTLEPIYSFIKSSISSASLGIVPVRSTGSSSVIKILFSILIPMASSLI